MFLQTTAKLTISYSYIGLAHRAALRLGLHRSVAANFTPIEQELRKRIFWVIRSMDIYFSTILGLPMTVNDDDIDQEYPLETDDEYITPVGILPMPLGRVSLMVGANAHIRLVGIMGKVLRSVYPVRPHGHKKESSHTYMISYATIRDIEGELDSWQKALPSVLQEDDEPPPGLRR